jgi:S-adenosylmethionine-diacylglycerol 3-amino-3-carboxypropyl transferase
VSGIVFTRAWEDDRVDLAALAVRPGEHVLAIAAAGDIPLALASDGATELIAVDLNPAQLHLSALKIAAAGWDAEERYRWFECGRTDRADEAYRTRLRPALKPDARAYWDARIGAFTSGLHDSEGVGRTFNRLGAFVRFIVPGLARDLERVATPAAQLRLWHERVQGRLFNRITDWLARHTPLLAPLAPNRQELDRMRRGAYLRAVESRVEGIVGAVLVREHPWWAPAFLGRPVALGHGAAWLDAERSTAVAAGAGRIRLVQGDVAAVLGQLEAGSLDAATVSNVPDWLDSAAARRLVDALARALRPGGRVLVRSVLPDGGLPEDPRLTRDPRSDAFTAAERTALYGRVDLLYRV